MLKKIIYRKWKKFAIMKKLYQGVFRFELKYLCNFSIDIIEIINLSPHNFKLNKITNI